MHSRLLLRRLLLPATVLASLAFVSASPAASGGLERGGERGGRVEQGRPFLDVRAAATAAPERINQAQEALRRSLGPQGVVDVDPLTGTPRVVARLDGLLTGPSSRDAKDIALEYVRAHPDVFKLDEGDLAALRLTRDYTDVAGIRHLVWAQTSRGIAAFDNDLRASLTADGRLVNVLGSPLPDLEAPATSPVVGAAGALAAALRDVGRPAGEPRVVARGRGARQATNFAGGHRANLVLFNDVDGVRLAWRVTANADSDEVYDSLVDATSGKVLRRTNKVEEVSGLAWDYHPTGAAGGGATSRNFTPWLSPGATRLFGANAHVFSDLNDDDQATVLSRYGDEEVGPRIADWDYAFTSFSPTGNFCSPSTCSWDSDDPGSVVTFPSWFQNRRQNATQVFYFVNAFHDYLKADPGIGFGATSTEGFEGVDRVIAHSDDGALTGTSQTLHGPNMPDEAHLDNANMLTRPDGQSPRMQMYLFASLDPLIPGDETPDVNGGDDAAVVYHEYVHGLSNRLITYSDGWGALDAFQSGAMGEAWSDWYAMDYLVGQGAAPDTATAGDVLLDRYVGNGGPSLRTQGLDCPVGVSTAGCPGGGYTYGDMGAVIGFPEVHSDGEIWAQTLWDLREHGGVGVGAARALVTEGMRLSPVNPSFLDMRNAILQADAAMGSGHADHVWEVFAGRGLGYFAATSDANDTRPVEDFQLPPAAGLVGTLSGVVRDPGNGNRPVAGALVRIPGNPANLSALTNARGQYSLANVPVGTYPLLRATKNLHDPVDASGVTVQDGLVTTRNLELRRDWSAVGGGARVSSFTPPNYGEFGCGPNGAIDQSLATGWGSDAGQARQITVKLPTFVDVTAFGVDPGATCGDLDDASLARFRLFVSKDGATFTQVADTTLGAGENHRLNTLDVADRTGIRYVRLTMISNQGHPHFMDMSELSVYGKLRPSCLGLAATKVGTEGADRMTGTRRADVFVGLGGNDRVDGRGGNDVVCGGDGSDTLVGGGGTDRVDAGRGHDTVAVRDGRRETVIRGGGGTDRLRRDRMDRASGFERSF